MIVAANQSILNAAYLVSDPSSFMQKGSCTRPGYQTYDGMAATTLMIGYV